MVLGWGWIPWPWCGCRRSVQIHGSQRLLGWALEEARHGVKRGPHGKDGTGAELGQAEDGSRAALLCGGSMGRSQQRHGAGWVHTVKGLPMGIEKGATS